MWSLIKWWAHHRLSVQQANRDYFVENGENMNEKMNKKIKPIPKIKKIIGKNN